MAEKLVIGFSDSNFFAKKVAKKIKAEYSDIVSKKFPDGESFIRFKKDLKNKEVILVRSLNDPNEKIVEIILAANTAKELGAKKVVLAAPYLAYLRQDKRFHSGEAVSNKIIAGLISGCFDKVITIDPHLHRIKSLKEIFDIKAVTLCSNKLIADYVKKHLKNPVIFGPDEESIQWAKGIADFLNDEVYILKKHRFSSRHVEIRLNKHVDLKGRDVVIVDDMISTGNTMIEIIKDVRRIHAGNIVCICVHALFIGNAAGRIRKAGAKAVISTNSIKHSTNKIDVSSLISEYA